MPVVFILKLAMWLARQNERVRNKMRKMINQVPRHLRATRLRIREEVARAPVPAVEVAMVLVAQKGAMAARHTTIVSTSPPIEVLQPFNPNGVGLLLQRRTPRQTQTVPSGFQPPLLSQNQIPLWWPAKIVAQRSRHFGVGMSRAILSAMLAVSNRPKVALEYTRSDS